MKPIYLDYNATAPLLPQAKEAMLAVMDAPMNASSVHRFGQEAKKQLNDARAEILHAVGADGHQLVFTASGTEANNLALQALPDVDTVFVSAIEHPCILKPAARLKASMIPVDSKGLVSLKALEKMLQALKAEKGEGAKALISIMLANNETGVIQPMKDIVALALNYGAFVHTDAVQCLGKIKLDFAEMNIDMMTLSAHKAGGPLGAAALVAKHGLHLRPQIMGGGQEKNYRAGTENLPAISGFAATARYVAASLIAPNLRDEMEAEMQKIYPAVRIFGLEAPRLPNTSCVAIADIPAETQLIHFDLAGIAVSAGAACSSGKVAVSHVLQAMGAPEDSAKCAIRISFGRHTTREEIKIFLTHWKKLINTLPNSKVIAA